MKKIRIFLAFLVFTCMFFITKVNALTSDITINSISIEDTGGLIEVEEPVLENNTITSKIVFNEENDYVNFVLVIKNNSRFKFKITSIEDNNTNDNISLEYSYSEDYIEKNGTSNINIKLSYKNKLTTERKLSLDNLTIKFNFEREDGETQTIIANPTTSDAILHYLVLLIVALFGIILVVVKKKNILGKSFIILATVLIPFATLANEKYEINLKFSNIELVGVNYAVLVDGETFNDRLMNHVRNLSISSDDGLHDEYEDYGSDTGSDTGSYDGLHDEYEDYGYGVGSYACSDSQDYGSYDYTFGSQYYNYNGYIDTCAPKTFRKATEEEYNNVKDLLTKGNIISDSNSPQIVYMWGWNSNLLYYSEADTIYLNPNSKGMYEDAYLTYVDLSGLDTGMLDDASEMFANSATMILDISSFDTSDSFDIEDMFKESYSLETIYVSDSWNIDDIDTSVTIFTNNCYLIGGLETVYDSENASSAYAHIDGGIDNPGYFTSKEQGKNFTYLPQGFEFKSIMQSIDIPDNFRPATEEEYNNAKPYLSEANIISRTITNPVYAWKDGNDLLYYSKAEKIYMNEDSRDMFTYLSFSSIDLTGFDSSRVTDMSNMFQDCSSLTNVDLSSFDTSNVTNMYSMFYNCSSLTNVDLSSFDTSNVTNMSNMFEGCGSLTSLDLSSFDTSNVTDMSFMFYNCSSLTTIYVTELWNIELTFNGCFNSTVIDTSYMFGDCERLVGQMGTIYDNENTDGVYARVDLGTSAPGYLTLKGDRDYTVLISGTNFNEKLQSMDTYNKSFRKATLNEYNNIKNSLTDENIVSLQNFSEVYMWEDSNNILYYSELEKIRLNPDASHMFENTSLVSIDLSELMASNTSDMSYMFYNCSSLTSIDFGVESVNPQSNNNNMAASIISALDGKNFNITLLLIPILLVIIGAGIYVIIKKIKTNKAEITIGVIVLIVLISSLIIVFGSFGIKKLLASVSQINEEEETVNFNTKNVTNMDSMFEGCSSLTELDISIFKLAKLEYFKAMFKDCSSLVTIYTTDEWDTKYQTFTAYGSYDPDLTSEMFDGCDNLVGGAGTSLSSLDYDYDSYYAGRYAVVDRGYVKPGFFTLKGSTINNNYAILKYSGDLNSQLSDYFEVTYGSEDCDDNGCWGHNYRVYTPPKYFRPATEEEYNSVKSSLTSFNIISDSGSPKSAYIWKDGDDLLYYSEADIIYMNKYSSYLFYDLDFVNIDLSGLDSSAVTNMSSMFYRCDELITLDISSFDTRNVTDMDYMFEYCSKLETIYVSNKWSINSDTINDSLFYNNDSLVGGAGTSYSSDNNSASYAHIDGGEDNPGYFTDINDKN